VFQGYFLIREPPEKVPNGVFTLPPPPWNTTHENELCTFCMLECMFDADEFVKRCPWIEELDNGTELMIAWATQGRQQLNSGIVDVSGKFDEITEAIEGITDDIDSKFAERFKPIEALLTTKNSSSKGKVGEVLYDNWISNDISKQWSTEVTKSQPHSGDFIHTHHDTKQQVIVDVKHYTKNVPTTEIDKLWSDMETTGIPLGLMVSLTSRFVKRRPGVDIEFRTIHGKPATMMFVSDALNHKEFIFPALEILRLHNPKTQFDIRDVLRPLHDIMGIISECEKNTEKLESDITRILTAHRSTTHIHYMTIQRILRGMFEQNM
jgi:hypothetical protein